MTQNGQITVASPFGTPATVTSEGNRLQTAVSSAREAMEVQARVVMAKRFPRDERTAMDRILTACTRPTLAAQAVYQYSRGESVEGPSIRLAETVAQHWGNLDYGFRELEQEGGASTVEAYCWDMETNVRAVRTFKVPHERHTRFGVKKLTDPRDIYETVANQAARRIRAAILEVVPGDVVEAAVAQCKATQEQSVRADGKNLAERVKDMVKKFADIGVTRAMLEAYTGRSLDAITPALFVRLGNVYKSIRDGVGTVEDYFAAAMDRAAEKKTKRASAAAVLKTGADAEATGVAGEQRTANGEQSAPKGDEVAAAEVLAVPPSMAPESVPVDGGDFLD